MIFLWSQSNLKWRVTSYDQIWLQAQKNHSINHHIDSLSLTHTHTHTHTEIQYVQGSLMGTTSTLRDLIWQDKRNTYPISPQRALQSRCSSDDTAKQNMTVWASSATLWKFLELPPSIYLTWLAVIASPPRDSLSYSSLSCSFSCRSV